MPCGVLDPAAGINLHRRFERFQRLAATFPSDPNAPPPPRRSSRPPSGKVKHKSAPFARKCRFFRNCPGEGNRLGVRIICIPWRPRVPATRPLSYGLAHKKGGRLSAAFKSREETPKEGICGRNESRRTAKPYLCDARNARTFARVITQMCITLLIQRKGGRSEAARGTKLRRLSQPAPSVPGPCS